MPARDSESTRVTLVVAVRRALTRRLGLISLLGATAALGASHVTEKMAMSGGAHAAPLAFLRGGISFSIVAAVWLVLRRAGHVSPAPRRAIPHVALIGVLASGISIALAILALRDTSATHKGIIQALYPVGTVAFAAALLGERLSGRTVAALIVVTAGLAALLSRGFTGAPNTGDWLLLATVPLIGFSDTWAKRTLPEVAPLTLAAGRQLFGWAFLAVALAGIGIEGLAPTLAMWPWVVAAGALAGAFVYCFYVGVERGDVTLAASVLTGAPVLTGVLEHQLLGAELNALQIAGALAVLAGVIGVVRETT